MRLLNPLTFTSVAASAAAMLWLGWQIVTVAVADYYALSRPERSLAWNPAHTEALIEWLDRQLPLASDIAEKDELVDLARVAAIGDPLNAIPLRIAALVAEEKGDLSRADTLMNMAARRSLRDVRSQVWLADAHLLKEDHAGAMKNIDALLRVWPGFGTTLYSVVIDLATDPESSDAVISTLEQGPPWRARFLSTMPRSHDDPTQLTDFYAKLGTGPAPPTTNELRAYLQALLDHGEPHLAQAVWREFLPPERQPGLGNIQNGDFEHPVNGLPFDWMIEPVRGGKVEVVSTEDGRVLRVEFYNTRVPFRHVSQVLLLAPGSYQLAGNVRADLRNERGLTWTVSCMGGAKTRLGETERIRGTLPWSEFATSFEVPKQDGCQSQLLRLELAARIPAEQEASGEIWFDDLRLDRAADGSELE